MMTDDLPDSISAKLSDLYELDDYERTKAVNKLIFDNPKFADPIRRRVKAAEAWFQKFPAGEKSWPAFIGPYSILGFLGEGGQAEVYLAIQKEPLHRLVALKVIKQGGDNEEVIARFELERRALAAMSHSNIAKIFHAGSIDQRPYFVMEFVEGSALTEYCNSRRLPLNDRILLFQKVCDGVQHAHHKGVEHRDLKPSNILVVREGDKATPKILDFGLAKATNREMLAQTIFTEQGKILGTPEYMAPEQATFRQEVIDTRADIYSLGVILYELLCGDLPFPSEVLRKDGWEGIQRILAEDEPEKPSTRATSVGDGASAQQRRTTPRAMAKQLKGDLDWIVMKALSKEPERRYESAAAFSKDLARYLNHEPTDAGPPGAGYRVKKLVRRYRGQVIAGALVLVTLVAGLTGTGIGWWKATKANEALGAALKEKDTALKEEERQRKRAEDAEKDARAEAARATRAEAETKARATELESEQQATRRASAEAYFQRALLARNHSDYASMLQALRDAENFGKDQIEVGIERIRALNGLGEPGRAVDEIARLRRFKLAPSQAARLQLFKANLDVNRLWDPEQNVDLIRDVLATEALPPVDAHYARALLADTVAEAQEHLDRARAIEPYYRDVNLSRAFLLLLEGRLHEATRFSEWLELQYPREIEVMLYSALTRGLAGDVDGSRRALDTLRTIDPKQASDWQPLILTTVALAHEFADLQVTLLRAPTPTKSMVSIGSLYWKLVRTAGPLLLRYRRPKTAQSTGRPQVLFILPPCAARGVRDLLAGVRSIIWNNSDGLITALQSATRRLGDAMYRFGEGWLLMETGRLTQAVLAFDRSVAGESLVLPPEVRLIGLLEAQRRVLIGATDGVERAAALDAVRRSLARLRVEVSPRADRMQLLHSIAAECSALDFSYEFAARWHRLAANDPVAAAAAAAALRDLRAH